MTKRTEQKDLFLAALRGDAKAQRACTSAGKPCGGRCIPKHWNCRIKGEGQTPPTRGNKVQLSAEQKQQIKKARQSRRIRAVGTVAAVAGGAAAIAALSAKNPQKARRLFKKGPGVAGALGVGGFIPGPTRKVALGGNLGLAGAHAAGAMGANFGQNKRGRRLYAQHFARLKSLEKQVNKLEPRHIRLSEKVSEAKKLVDAANNQLNNKGTSKYSLNNATRSIAQQDRIRKQNVKSAYGSLRKANANLNAFESQTGFRKVKSEYTRTLKATTKIKSILLKPYKTKDVVGGVLNDYRASYLKGYNYARRQIRGIGIAQARRGPKANNVPFYARPELQADAAEEHQRADKKCGKSAIPDKWNCTKAVQAVAENKGTVAVAAVYAGAAGAMLGAGLLASRNARIRGKLKFGGNDRITPFSGSIGDVDGVMSTFRTKSAGGDSMFGDVLIGKSGDKNLVVKKITNSKNSIPASFDPVAQMKKRGIIDDKTASNLIKQRKSLMESEVTIAKAAGELGFGPKVVAAKKNTLIMGVAEGKPLLDKYVKQGPAGIQATSKQLNDFDKKQVLSSMAKMHTGGIAHNDMHLGNTFQGKKGVQFIDFGTAQRGGGPVAMEFVRQMNPPRFGENYLQGNGYNLKTLDPRGYSKAEREIKRTIGKRVGTLRDNDIAKAVAKNPELGNQLQTIVDNYYVSLSGSRTDSASRVDKKCGNSGIPEKAKCTKGAGSAAAPQKPGPQSAGFIAKHKKHGGYSPSFFKSLNKAERAEFKALNEYAGSKKGRRERELQAIGGIAKGVAQIAAVGAVGGYGTAKALQALNRAGKGRSKLSSSRSRARKASYIKAKMEIMRNKGTGKYGARPRRKTGGSFRPDIEAIQGDAEGKKYSKTVTDPKTGRKRTVKYGAKGYTIAPGTKRGNSYCARSFGDMKSHNKNCAGKDRNTPLCLSRAKWKCSGKASRKDAGEKRLGKPCGNSHIPKRYNCSKDRAKDRGINKKAVAATVIAGAVGALAVGVALDARTLKKGFGIPPTPGFGSSMKKIMKEKGVDIQEASSIYYDRVVGKEGWKTGELVYTRSGKAADFSHYAIYMGKKDGVHTFAQMGADGIAANAGGIQETKYGPGVKAGDRGAAIFARPPKEYRAKKTLSGDEIAKRIDALKGKPLKYEAFSDNCETWARMIVGDGSRSLQAKKLTLTTKTAIRGVYKGLGKIAKEWGDGDDFPVVNGPVLSARKMARMLDSQDPVGNVGAFESLVDRSRRDAITSKHIGLITADALLTENMSAIEAVARVKRYLILLSAITVDMNK